ncbi:hypothetical protein [Cryobacterium sp. MDB2-33-2]|uniref:hypothetical protein n=1 Tax=Cryobacterium sp. MDB2-33-2 TaxID=1259179 RepID=UPI00106B8582|nr:hypothetical protein [Cryobacterium sp. MDB2-33-2]TFC08479.1 hypothetical protein E3O59_08480 [Cryobacterium sp. MDB2-33-2]
MAHDENGGVETLNDSVRGTEIALAVPVRGFNPRPESGWPWFLTEYEVNYVERFNVRPMRDQLWADEAAADARLDLEAEGVRFHPRAKLKAPRQPTRLRRHVRHPWIVITIAALLVGAAAYYGYRSQLNMELVHKLTSEVSTWDAH